MAETFLTFQKFNDIVLANEVAEKLRQYNIPFLIENNQKLFDPSFGGNTVEPAINLKLKPEDFTKAHRALDDYYKKQLEEIDKGYYLFEFTDEELIDVISKPDEWGHFDYQLAQKILKDRNKEISPEVAELLRTQRIKDLAKPISAHKYLIYTGYFLSIFTSLFGIIIGWTLAYYKRTLPTGERIYAYREKDRNHGVRMLFISVASIIFWAVVRWWFFNED